jgi:hypothetical protein
VRAEWTYQAQYEPPRKAAKRAGFVWRSGRTAPYEPPYRGGARQDGLSSSCWVHDHWNAP